MQDAVTNPEASLVAMLKNARGDLFVQCPTQLAVWLSSDERLAAIKWSLLQGSVDQIQLVLDEPNPDTTLISELINLSRRLSSKFLIRCVTVDAEKFNEMTLRNHHSLWVGQYNGFERAPTTCSLEKLSQQQRLIAQDSFARLWDHQTWDNPNIRAIYV